MTPESESEFRAYVEARRGALLRTAFLTCGDWHRAEDAVQTSLIKLYGAWSRTRRETTDAYTRRILANVLIDQTRRGWFRRESSYADPPEQPDASRPDDQAEAASILAKLPLKQRATLVLRFWEDQSVEQTAKILRCTTGTVKSNTARGLKTLRQHYATSNLASQGSK
ncbi:SigE family RNA polymerase sigma factor [Glycomyces harbinensis]|uniref:RNA polymerase sigma-70 factor, sigma-E family n=1 Tax=Glycomyces harbinensis TaxID=58114 RepID=A0A1G7AAZ6_9ACTN|nr:SigE family RNA polymerase sigma factor [Glycomyces harbinensis]SDE11971.1 RNA polymerase sigma-70 factor, sigma-E family [Glycomyces harbinensis]